MAHAAHANADTTLVIDRQISATPAQVYAALTDPKIIKQWMGPGDVECVSVETNAKVGGTYRFHMRSEEGDHIAIGKYLELVPGKKLVYTWAWENGSFESKVTITLVAAGDKRTDLHLVHEHLPSKEEVAAHSDGWNACLDQLAALY